jgi:proteasome lid subunit RPN8/RPN11
MRKLCIYLDSELLEEILENTRIIHPREIILLIRGKKRKKSDLTEIYLREYVVPPLPVHGKTLASYSSMMLPFYLDIVGTYHSHPSGNPLPSIPDLNNFIGLFIAVAIPPYQSIDNIYFYNKDGRKIPVKVIE